MLWNGDLGDCEIKSQGFGKPYTFIVSLYQATIMMLFNTQDEYTFKELYETVGLSPEVASKQLFNLANPRMGKLLIKANIKTPNFSSDEKISLNKNFVSGNYRVVMSFSSVKKKTDYKKEYGEELKEINKNRAAVLQTTIVKIMKGRREKKHNELIVEVLKMIQSFKPDPMRIKQQIE